MENTEHSPLKLKKKKKDIYYVLTSSIYHCTKNHYNCYMSIKIEENKDTVMYLKKIWNMQNNLE